MILQALYSYYQRLLQNEGQGLAPFGYSPEKISYEIVLALNGEVVAVNDIRDTTGKKPIPKVVEVPQPPKRASNIAPCFLWDKTSYVLGVTSSPPSEDDEAALSEDEKEKKQAEKERQLKRTAQEHEAFKTLHSENLSDITDEGIVAFLRFLSAWTPERFAQAPFNEEMRGSNIVFRLDGEKSWLHQRPAAQNARAKLLAADETAPAIHCLVTGQHMPAARLHPAIKGVTGAQSSGASIVSFNKDAFTSYGKSQGDNAPISEHAAFAYTTVLNHLLRSGEQNRQRLQIGDTTVVFWAEAENPLHAEEAELTFSALLDEPPDDSQEALQLRSVLEQVAKGRPLSEINPNLQDSTRIYVLGLAPNASRISIRFWESQTLDIFAKRLAQHAQDLHLEPLPWRTAPSVVHLVLATAPARWNAQKKRYEADRGNVSPLLAGEVLRAVLTGGLYPRSLLANTLMRIRTDGNLSGLRAAICKGVLARERRLGINMDKEEIPVSLNKESVSPGYRLGRLFAVLESVQRSALGGQVNATIRDRYFGAASTTPATVFPMLLRNAQNHLSKLRKEKPGLAVNMEKEIGDIVNGLADHFPRSLRLEAQGQFAIGYYHQTQSRFNKTELDDEQDNAEGETE